MPKNIKSKPEELVVDFNDFEFIHDHVLLKSLKIASKEGWAKPKQKDDKPEIGRIISIGRDCGDELKVGDIVLFGRYVSEETNASGETYHFVRYEDIKGYNRKLRNGKK